MYAVFCYITVLCCYHCIKSVYSMVRYLCLWLYNVICSVCVVGTIPSSLGSLTALKDLRLQKNILSGMMVHFQCSFCVDMSIVYYTGYIIVCINTLYVYVICSCMCDMWWLILQYVLLQLCTLWHILL